jgi:hypothetical protein
MTTRGTCMGTCPNEERTKRTLMIGADLPDARHENSSLGLDCSRKLLVLQTGYPVIDGAASASNGARIRRLPKQRELVPSCASETLQQRAGWTAV